MINIKIGANGVPDLHKVEVANKWENLDEIIKFELPEYTNVGDKFEDMNKYVIAILKYKGTTTTVISPIINDEYRITSKLTHQPGNWNLYLMARSGTLDLDQDEIDIRAKKDEHVFISDGFVAVVKSSYIDAQFEDAPDENLEVLYNDLLSLRSNLINRINGLNDYLERYKDEFEQLQVIAEANLQEAKEYKEQAQEYSNLAEQSKNDTQSLLTETQNVLTETQNVLNETQNALSETQSLRNEVVEKENNINQLIDGFDNTVQQSENTAKTHLSAFTDDLKDNLNEYKGGLENSLESTFNTEKQTLENIAASVSDAEQNAKESEINAENSLTETNKVKADVEAILLEARQLISDTVEDLQSLHSKVDELNTIATTLQSWKNVIEENGDILVV